MCVRVCLCPREMELEAESQSSLLLLFGSETHTAAGEAEHSVQRDDQVSDVAQQRGTGMVS